MKVGLIAGRHPLPVERYLLDAPVDASPAAVSALQDAIIAAVEALPAGGHVDLYLTGLTRAAILAVAALQDHELTATLYEFDQATGQYVATMEVTPHYHNDDEKNDDTVGTITAIRPWGSRDARRLLVRRQAPAFGKEEPQ